MKKSLKYLLILLLLGEGPGQILANPLPITVINEFLISSADSGGWTLELIAFNFLNESLDGWSIISSSGTADFKQGISTLQGDFLLITSDSLQTPLSFTADHGVIAIFNSEGERWDELRWGAVNQPDILAPLPGQSICYGYTGSMFQIWYLDNSPTLGSGNDLLGGEGSVTGMVYDMNGSPLSQAYIDYRPGTAYDYMTGPAGSFEFTQFAGLTPMRIAYDGVVHLDTTIQLYPDSVLTLEFTLPNVVRVREPNTNSIPSQLVLGQNFPNPFNATTRIPFALPRDESVLIQVWSVDGSLVATLLDQPLRAGRYRVSWDAAEASSGLYLCRFQAGSEQQSRKLILLK